MLGKTVNPFDDQVTAIKCRHCGDEDLYRWSARSEQMRKATIVQSTRFWRLDGVSLAYMMTVKYMPKAETIKQKDGGPTVTVHLRWGASQGKR